MLPEESARARPLRSDLTPWTLRGMGLALGATIVIGLIALASAAGSVLVLFFLAVLLASALEPIIQRLGRDAPADRPVNLHDRPHRFGGWCRQANAR